MVEAQIDSPHPAFIKVGTRGQLFTMLLTAKDEDARSDGKQPETIGT
jgi:hypothetical protein